MGTGHGRTQSPPRGGDRGTGRHAPQASRGLVFARGVRPDECDPKDPHHLRGARSMRVRSRLYETTVQPP